MFKKYLPFIVLILAAGLLFFVKKNQRGHARQNDGAAIEVPAAVAEGFVRDTAQLVYSKHAKCRMACRFIDESEVKEILLHGTINYDKIESDARGKTIPLEGITHDEQLVRIVIAPKNNALVVVTVIDLKTDFECSCN